MAVGKKHLRSHTKPHVFPNCSFLYSIMPNISNMRFLHALKQTDVRHAYIYEEGTMQRGCLPDAKLSAIVERSIHPRGGGQP